jgi:TP901 family phage tail tape measure protein
MANFDISVVVSLIDQISDRASRVKESLRSIGDEARNMARAMQDRGQQMVAIGEGMEKMGTGMMLKFTAPAALMYRSAMQYEEVLTNLRTTFHGTNEQFEQVRKNIEDLATATPHTKAQITDLFTQFAASRAPIEQWNDLFQTTSTTALATGQDLNTTADWMMGLRNAMKLNNDQLKVLGAQLNFVSENAGANAAEIADLVGAWGGMANTLGGTKAVGDLMAFSAAAAGAGADAGTLSFGLRSLLGIANRASEPTKEQAAALQTLGISAEGLQKALSGDLGSGLFRLMERISQLPSDEQGQVLRALFGPRGQAGLAGLLGDMERLKNIIQGTRDTEEILANLERDRLAKLGTPGARMQMFINALGNLKDIIAKPWLDNVTPIIERLTGFLSNLDERHPKMLQAISYGFGALATAGPGLWIAAQAVKTFGTLLTAGGAVLGSPGPLLALGLLALAGYEIYKNWEKIAPMWNELTTAASGLWQELKPLGEALTELVDQVLPGIDWSNLTKGFPEDMANMIQSIADAITSLTGALKTIREEGFSGMFERLTGIPVTPEGKAARESREAEERAIVEGLNKPKTPFFPGFFGGGGAPTTPAPLSVPAPMSPLPGRVPSGTGAYNNMRSVLDRLNASKLPATAAANAPPTGGPLPPGISIMAEGPSVTIRQAPPNQSIVTNVFVSSPDMAPAATGAAVSRELSGQGRGGFWDNGN